MNKPVTYYFVIKCYFLNLNINIKHILSVILANTYKKIKCMLELWILHILVIQCEPGLICDVVGVEENHKVL